MRQKIKKYKLFDTRRQSTNVSENVVKGCFTTIYIFHIKLILRDKFIDTRLGGYYH